MSGLAGLSAEQVVNLLDLTPHPEGGHFRETFRDPATDAAGRSRSPEIYCLLAAGEISLWHRVDAVEVWHYYAGAPLELTLSPDGQVVQTHLLGPAIKPGAAPQAVVPPGWWQAAEPLGAWTLVGCTVAPGFDFSGFEMAPPGWRPSPRPSTAG